MVCHMSLLLINSFNRIKTAKMQLNSAPYAGLAKFGSLNQHHIYFSKVA